MNPIVIITYSKSKLKYELIDLLAIVGFLSILILIIGQKTKNEFIERNQILFATFFVLGFVWLVIRMFIGKKKWYKPVVEAGKIEFRDNFLALNELKIMLNEIKKIRICATSCKGFSTGGRSGLSDGTGNFIEIFLNNRSRIRERFLIENVRQREDLKALLDIWKQKGIIIIGVWKPLLHIFQK